MRSAGSVPRMRSNQPSTMSSKRWTGVSSWGGSTVWWGRGIEGMALLEGLERRVDDAFGRQLSGSVVSVTRPMLGAGRRRSRR